MSVGQVVRIEMLQRIGQNEAFQGLFQKFFKYLIFNDLEKIKISSVSFEKNNLMKFCKDRNDF